MKQILLHTVIRHKYVGESVAIIVGECYSQCAPFLSCDAGALADIGKGSIPVVVIKNVGGGGKFLRGTISMEISATVFAVLRVPLHISGNKQNRPPLILVAAKTGPHSP